MNIRPRILFLPRWYPNAADPMPGLFIQRQAESVNHWCDVAVLYTHPDPDAVNTFESVFSRENGIHTLKIYYRVSASDNIFSKFRNHLLFIRANIRGFRMLRDFKPDLVHVHTLTRHGVIAWVYKIMTGTPYIITEHWSRYLVENNNYHGWIRKFLTRLVVKRASAVIAVSEILRDAMLARGLRNKKYRIVANPAHMEVFKCPDLKAVKNDAVKRIVHISCFEDASKNISGLLRSLKDILEKRDDFSCHLVGTGPDHAAMVKYASELGMTEKNITFTGLLEGNDLVREICDSDFMVLSSRYETFGAVVVESLACGIPVLATRVGIVPQVVGKDNGIVIDPADDAALREGIDLMLDRCRTFDREKVRASVSARFSNDAIGRDLMNIYSEVLNKRHIPAL